MHCPFVFLFAHFSIRCCNQRRNEFFLPGKLTLFCSLFLVIVKRSGLPNPMSCAEATRLARICLPVMLHHKVGGGPGIAAPDKDEALLLSSSSAAAAAAASAAAAAAAVAASATVISKRDVEHKTLWRLWAGMGHVYKVSINNVLPGRRGHRPLRFIAKRVTPPPGGR
jgi:hypothetical protein